MGGMEVGPCIWSAIRWVWCYEVGNKDNMASLAEGATYQDQMQEIELSVAIVKPATNLSLPEYDVKPARRGGW